MTDKAYIVANEEQELEILKKFEKDGIKWRGGRKPTESLPGTNHPFPIILFESDYITWDFLDELKDETVVYDGRKEEKKYKVTQEFMNELIKWRDKNDLDFTSGYNHQFMAGYEIQVLPGVVDVWRTGADSSMENNNRLISILKWLNGEDMFESEKPKKWVVRNKENDSDYCYAQLLSENNNTVFMGYSLANATRFNTKEEAQSWANSHQVVVEIDEE